MRGPKEAETETLSLSELAKKKAAEQKRGGFGWRAIASYLALSLLWWFVVWLFGWLKGIAG